MYSENFATYENKNLGIKIEYPRNLDKIENNRGSTFTNEGSTLGVIIGNIPLKNTSLSDFRTQQILQLSQTLTNFKITNSKVSDIMGYPTQMLLFNYDNGTQLYRGLQFIKISDDNAYVFTYFAPHIVIFREFLPTVKEMFDSLQLS